MKENEPPLKMSASSTFRTFWGGTRFGLDKGTKGTPCIEDCFFSAAKEGQRKSLSFKCSPPEDLETVPYSILDKPS